MVTLDGNRRGDVAPSGDETDETAAEVTPGVGTVLMAARGQETPSQSDPREALGLVMFRCERHHATLTKRTCGRRWSLANAGGPRIAGGRTSQVDIEDLRASGCVGCPIGAENVNHARKAKRRRFKASNCKHCGVVFQVFSPTQIYCGRECLVEWHRKRKTRIHE